MVFSVENEKNEHYHWDLHIRILLGTKFHFNQTLMSFAIKFAKKGYFRLKTENVNIII